MPTVVQIILLTETWIANETQAQELQLDNYTHYYNFRTDTIGGGVSIYVHNNLNHTLSESIYKDGNNYLWIRLEKYSLDVGVIYYPGNTSYQTFLEELNIQLQRKTRAIVFGDFNVDLLSKEKRTKEYKETINDAGYKIINKITKKYSTRDSPTKKSILDHIITNLNNENFHVALIESAMSDHKQICVQLKKFKSPPKKRTRYEAVDYNKLYNLVKENGIDETICEYSTLEDIIVKLIKDCKTVKTKIINLPKQDWINKDIIYSINKRNQLLKELRSNPKNELTEEEFKTEKESLAKIIQNTKDSYYYNQFMCCLNKPKKMWTLVNYLAKNKIVSNYAPTKLIIRNKQLTNTKDICDEFNKYFSTIGCLLANKIPKVYHDNPQNALPCIAQNSKLLTFDPCSADEILKIIINLDSNSSTGLDGISTKSIKCLKDSISFNLAKCFNNLLQNGVFPDSMKLAKVTPIHKSGVKTDPGNFRPISVLPILSKILEKILHHRLEKYLNSINYIYQRQYGFRRKRNTLTATIDLVTKIRSKIDNKNIALGLFIDLKKAFDTISPVLMIKKLKSIGIDGTALKMFESYLQNRFQVVKIDNTESSKCPVTFGIPQGSILGPLLFITYINNIHELKLHGHLSLYADDTCLFYFGPSIHDIMAKAQEDLDTLCSWFQYNLLTINAAKTCYVVFKAKNKIIPNHQPLSINNVVLQEKSCEKYLGLRLDSHLTWNSQIEHIRAKLSSLNGSLRHIVRCIPHRIRYTIYNSLVKPHLLYLIEIWGSAAKTRLKNLQIYQNKIIKTIFRYNFFKSTTKVYSESKLMTIRQLYIYNTCILIHKILSSSLHTNLSFIRHNQTTKRVTRRASFLVLPKIRTNYGRKMITYEGAQLYNKLPCNIKNITSFDIFKTKLGKHVIENC